MRLEGFEHGPDFQQGVDPVGADWHEVAVIVADTFPFQHCAAGDGLGHREGHVLLAGGFRQAVDGLTEASSQEDMALAMAKAVARRAVLEWEGVGDDDGNLVPVSPDGIDALLEIWPVFEAFQAQYVARGLMLDQEKNVSAPSPTGPSAGATATARPAHPARAPGASAPTAPQD